MKKIKFTIIIIMLCFFHIINGEMFQREIKFFPASVSNFIITSLPSKNDDEVIQDICNFANANDVFVYVTMPRSSSITTYELNIYCSSVNDIKQYFNDKFNINEKTYKSIFSGNTVVKFRNISEVPNIYSCSCFYVVGENENVNNFINSISAMYGIGDFKQGYENFDYIKSSVIILCITGSILLLLTLYELSLKRKETVISLSLGESANSVIIKNIAADSCVLLLTYFLTQAILSIYTQSYHYFSVSLKIYLVIICVNAFIYLKIKFYSFRKAFSRNTSDVELLTASYLVKLMSTTIVILVLLPNCIFISKAISYNKQETFFTGLKNYNYISFGLNQNIQIDDIDQELMNFSVTNQLYDQLYAEHFNEFKPKITMDITPENNSQQYVYYNKHTLEYLKSSVKELNRIDLKDKIYICIPYDTKLLDSDKSDIIQSIKNEYLVSLDKLYNYDCEIIEYKPQTGIVSINSYLSEGSNFVNAPIIIFNNIDESNAELSFSPMASFWGQFRNSIMYEMDENDFITYMTKQGLNENDYRYRFTNVYDSFSEQKALINRELLIVSVISIMLLMIQTGIIIVIIRLEYSVKASEYCIKKLLGYSSFETNRYIYCHTSINYLLVNIVLGFFMKSIILSKITLYITIQLISLIIELVVISRYTRKMNEVNMNKILKGGKL